MQFFGLICKQIRKFQWKYRSIQRNQRWNPTLASNDFGNDRFNGMTNVRSCETRSDEPWRVTLQDARRDPVLKLMRISALILFTEGTWISSLRLYTYIHSYRPIICDFPRWKSRYGYKIVYILLIVTERFSIQSGLGYFNPLHSRSFSFGHINNFKWLIN